MLFDDNDDKKNKDKNKPKEKKVWIVWWDKNLNI